MIDVDKMQNEVNNMEYQDAPILDIQAAFLGDEISIYIENDKDTSYKVLFSECLKVTYTTDVAIPNWRKGKVRDMSRSQLGYFAQEIELFEEEEKGFIRVECNFHPMYMTIICKEIELDKIKNSDINFFWGNK
ncbi:MAG: hypothetical protein LBI13_02550 [Streptococcaceae bacterium]|jgi:hypothetical protein|nr:hypothetical protein [Streptococcaceae bacterium]